MIAHAGPVGTGSTIGFIGIGVMGSSMAGHLLDAGYALRVYTRTPEKAGALVDRGALWAASPGEAADGADVVITMVGYPADVEQVYLGEDGVLERAAAGTVLIDMTTSSPALARRIATEAAERGVHALDAPVSGGDVGAREARLTIMVGGSEEAFRSVEPVLGTMGANVVLHGPAGSGQHAKMANQIAIAGSMLGMVEMLAYARAAGLDPERALRSVSAGSAASWSIENLAPRILRGDLEPGFYVKHFIKDMEIALAMASELGVELPGLALARELYGRLAEEGGAELGTQALWLLYAGTDQAQTSGSS